MEPEIYQNKRYTVYLLNGNYHCEDGPAYIHKSGLKKYYVHGKLHRTDGPAIIFPNGGKSWYINGKNIDREVRKFCKEVGLDRRNLTPEDEFIIGLRFQNSH